MSSSALHLNNILLHESMPVRSKEDDQSQHNQGSSGRFYDLSCLPAAQRDAARDGLASRCMRLLPVLTKAQYPESGFVGFEITETHHVRIPLTEDGGTDSSAFQCNCACFRRLNICSHLIWLYDGLSASLNSQPAALTASSEVLTEEHIGRKFTEFAARLPQQSRGLTERINHLNLSGADQDDVTRAIIDVFAVFDEPTETSPRKRRRPEENMDESRPTATQLRTCLEISREEFFNDVSQPKDSIHDVVVPGKLLPTMKGLARYGTVFREALFRVVDPGYRATDFISRLDGRLCDWKERWMNFRKDRRTTVPSTFVTDYADVLRDVLRQLKAYDVDRDCPDFYYDQAIDLGITMLEEICKSNVDLYEGHSRQTSQAKHTVPQNVRDRNLFSNLVLSPPTGQKGFVQSLVEMFFQFRPEHLDDEHLDKLQNLATEIRELENVQQPDVMPLQDFLRRYEQWRVARASTTDEHSPHSRESSMEQQPKPDIARTASQIRRYRELRAAPLTS